MLNINIDKDNGFFHIQKSNGSNSITICQGYFSCDQPDSTTLIIITQIAIVPQDHDQLYDILSYISKIFIESYTNKVFLRLPSTFDGQIEVHVLDFNEKVPSLMTLNRIDLKFVDNDLVPYNREKYALVIDKRIALDYSEDLLTLMNVEAYWANNWTSTQMRNRIESASAIAVILDRTTGLACGFGRLFVVKENGDVEISTFGYLSDICVHSDYQRQGLGRVIANSLIGAYLSSTINSKETDASLALLCTNRGSGAIAAPQLYRKFGFQFINQIRNAVAVFGFRKPPVAQST
jgi:ribosomal protein S18 acetylase RimI-like enzyme